MQPTTLTYSFQEVEQFLEFVLLPWTAHAESAVGCPAPVTVHLVLKELFPVTFWGTAVRLLGPIQASEMPLVAKGRIHKWHTNSPEEDRRRGTLD